VAVLPSSADPQRRSANVTTVMDKSIPFSRYGSSGPLLKGSVTSSQQMLYFLWSKKFSSVKSSRQWRNTWDLLKGTL